MTPEVQILLINAAALALSYGLIYPRLLPITLGKIFLADLVLSALLLGGVGYIYWGKNLQLWLFGWYVGPLLFTFVTLLAMEYPLFSWFVKKHDIRF